MEQRPTPKPGAGWDSGKEPKKKESKPSPLKKPMIYLAIATVLLAGGLVYLIVFLNPGDGGNGTGPGTATGSGTGGNGQPPVSSTPEEFLTFRDKLIEGANQYYGRRTMNQLTANLEKIEASADVKLKRLRFMELGREFLKFGQNDGAVKYFGKSLELAEDPKDKMFLMEKLAVAHLRVWEANNCLNPKHRMSCTLPFGPMSQKASKKGTTEAIAVLMDLLKLDPSNVRAQWLLNIAHMQQGTYPAEVAPKYLVPASSFTSSEHIGEYRNMAPELGLDHMSLAGGAVMEDMDGDGFLDIVTSTWDPAKSLRYMHNNGDGTFSDWTKKAGLHTQLGGLNITQTDFNNDGHIDLFVMRGAWLKEDGRIRNSLLKNDGKGRFEDVTLKAGLALTDAPTQTAAWADFDLDGDLDVYVGNERMSSQLFRNNGDGTFTDIAQPAGVLNNRFAKAAVWGDFNNDRYPDLYVSNYGEDNRLYQNNGDGSFKDVAKTLDVQGPKRSFGAWFWDFNNDGLLDIYCTSYGGDIGEVAKDYLDLEIKADRPRLYMNVGGGAFKEVAEKFGVHKFHLPMGANFGDINNDGFPDFYLGTGFPTYEALEPNVMFLNREGRSFTDVTNSGGFGHVQKGHGIAFGDLDRDGDQDIYVQLGGFYPADAFRDALHVNPGNKNKWLTLLLVGQQSNRFGIGARIQVTIQEQGEKRVIHKCVTTGGSFGASSLQVEVGLGMADRILDVRVYWPKTELKQVFEKVPLNSVVELTENKSEFRTLKRPAIKLGK